MRIPVHFNIILIILIILTVGCAGEIEISTADNFEQVELPDSSIVYLNHNSKLTYDESFNPRTLRLEGEAFFSVNDGETPFKIISPEGEEITVLGTEFNLIINPKNVILEVEIGKVNIRIGDKSNDVGRGKRLFYGRHDNGLHLGHAKHKHRNWISVMSKDFGKSGKVLKRSFKHSNKVGKKGVIKGNKNTKSVKSKGGGGNKLPKMNKPSNKKSGGGKPKTKGGADKGSKDSKGKKGKG